MKGKFEIGKLYKVRFYDHCVGGSDKIICEVCGWVIKEDKEFLTLTSWLVDTKDQQVRKDNVETVNLIKSCIIRKRKIS